jgi:hypothetical protein
MDWNSSNDTLATGNLIICRNKYKELSDLKKKKLLERQSQLRYGLVKQKNVKNLWKYIRNTVQKVGG